MRIASREIRRLAPDDGHRERRPNIVSTLFKPSAIAAVTSASLVALALLAPSDARAADPKLIDDELQRYWNVELAVPTTQNPLHVSAGAFELAVGAGVVPNDSYYLGLPIALRGGFHVSETLSIEAAFTYLVTMDSDLHSFLKNQNLLQNVHKPPHMGFLAAVDLVYSPFHGKVGMFASKLSSFDIGLAIGAGVIGVELDGDNPYDTLTEAAVVPAGHWGATLRFYLNDWMTVRWDYRQFAYMPEKDVLFPVELTLSSAFLFN